MSELPFLLAHAAPGDFIVVRCGGQPSPLYIEQFNILRIVHTSDELLLTVSVGRSVSEPVETIHAVVHAADVIDVERALEPR